jgi:hypothetical protein
LNQEIMNVHRFPGLTSKALREKFAILVMLSLVALSRSAGAAVFYSSEYVVGVTQTGVASLNTHLHSTSSLSHTATFDYGLTSAYGTTVAGTGGANNVTPFYDGNMASVAITGLSCGTTYHWSVVVAGTHDNDQTFTTSACPAPAISVNPGSGAFGLVVVGATANQRTFTISNPGTATLVVSGIDLSGPVTRMFDLALGTCPSFTPSIGAGSSCTVQISFTALSPGRKTATLGITSNAGASNIPLSGTGAADGTVPTLSEWGTLLLAAAFAMVLAVQARNGARQNPA